MFGLEGIIIIQLSLNSWNITVFIRNFRNYSKKVLLPCAGKDTMYKYLRQCFMITDGILYLIVREKIHLRRELHLEKLSYKINNW